MSNPRDVHPGTMTLVSCCLARWRSPDLRSASGRPGRLPHPIAFAGWVGIFITRWNLIPIGQLTAACAPRAAPHEGPSHCALLLGAMAGVVAFGYWGWLLMLFLLVDGPDSSTDGQRRRATRDGTQ